MMEELKALKILKDLLGEFSLFDNMTDTQVREYILESIQELEDLHSEQHITQDGGK